MLLAAAAAEGRVAVGIDVSMVWLIAARRLVEVHGGTPVLAAAFAEALPLADQSVSCVLALDVIEHVADQPAMLREIDRVIQPGGHLMLSTPNRFSLGPEPHVSVWGVGWLPRRLQDPYVRLRTGHAYGQVQSLSSWEAARLLQAHTHLQFRFLVPEIPSDEITRFSRAKATLAYVYNWLVRLGGLKGILLRIGPFFRIVGRKFAEEGSGALASQAQ